MILSYRLFLILITLSLFSCGEDYAFEISKPIPESGWTYENILKYEFEINDSSELYDLYLRIDYSTHFSRQNIYANIYTGSHIDSLNKARVSLDISNNLGIWKGDCKGENCAYLLPLQKSIFFKSAGIQHFWLEQFTRIESLQEIQKITLIGKKIGRKDSL